MVALTATSGVTSSVQVSLIQQRLEAARREEARAEAEVASLRTQTDAAEARLQERQGTVDRLSGQSSDPTYQSSLQDSGGKLSVQNQQPASESRRSTGNHFPNINAVSSTGQTVGRLIHVTA